MPAAFDAPSISNTSSGEPDPARRSTSAWQRARSQIYIILTIGTCVIALLWLIMIVVIETERRAAMEHARSEANNLSAAFEGEVTQTLKSVAHAMDFVTDHMRAAHGQFNIHEWAKEIPWLAAATVQGSIVGPDGILVSSTLDAHPRPIDITDREHFRVHLDGNFKGVFISRPVIGRVSQQNTIQVSKRVDAEDGTFLGVVVFSLVPGQLSSLHRTIDLGPGGRLILVGSTDQIVRARFGVGSEDGDSGAGEWVPPPPGPFTSEGAPQSFIRESVLDHVSRLHSTRSVTGYPLRVAVALDLTEILRPAAAHARLIMAIGIIATLMLVGLMTLLVLEIRRRTDREVKLGDERARLAAEIYQGRQVQEQLRSSEARLRDFAEMASDWFWEQDAELRFTPLSLDTPRLSADDMSFFGKHRWDVNDPKTPPEHWESHKRDLMDRKPFRDFRYCRARPDGTVQHVSVNGVPVCDENGVFAGYRGTGRDITAKVEADDELRRSKEKAEASDQAKSAFLANMSHELRTPLNAIIGFAELIYARKTGRITEESVEWAGDILASGRHLLDLINNVLELSKIESGRHDLTDDTVDLGVLTRACLPMIRREAEKNRVRIDCEIEEGVAALRADRRAIKQVLLNLLSNAVKFTPPGGIVTIHTELAKNGDFSLVVTDTGIGIDPVALPKLCKPFIQADASTSRRYGGTGLGLAISTKLIALHGGTLTIASMPGQGTTVRVNFPEARLLEMRRLTAEAV